MAIRLSKLRRSVSPRSEQGCHQYAVCWHWETDVVDRASNGSDVPFDSHHISFGVYDVFQRGLGVSLWLTSKSSGRYFQGSNGTVGTSSQTTALNKIFDKYRDSPVHNPDTIGVEGSMRYMADLQVELDDVATLAVAEALSAPTMGEFNREGFVQGWKSSNADTLPKQQAVIATFRTRLTTDPDFFKRVYKHTFLIARTPGQKAVALDAAIEFWRLLFSPPSVSWNTASTPWLDWWIEYLESKLKKTVNKDMWEQTLVFSQKSLQDETMSWWSEDGAWPGVLDEFVAYVNERKGEEGVMDLE